MYRFIFNQMRYGSSQKRKKLFPTQIAENYLTYLEDAEKMKENEEAKEETEGGGRWKERDRGSRGKVERRRQEKEGRRRKRKGVE